MGAKDKTTRAKTTAESCEYVENFTGPLEFPRDVRSMEDGAGMLIDYLDRRIDAALEKYPTTPVAMLSGGIDSILATAVLAGKRPDTVAFTFSFGGAEEGEKARQVAEHLGIEHYIIAPQGVEAEALLADVVHRLEHTDAWEVLAGAVFRAVDKASTKMGLGDGAIITGDAADILLFGGKEMDPEKDPVEYMNEQVQNLVETRFARDLQIPDFYERLLDNPDRHIKTWQTEEAFRVTARLHPAAIRGEDYSLDKEVARFAARSLGVPAKLTAATKDPLQTSSGGLDMAVSAAAWHLAQTGGHSYYTDPTYEDTKFVATRLYLELLAKVN